MYVILRTADHKSVHLRDDNATGRNAETLCGIEYGEQDRRTGLAREFGYEAAFALNADKVVCAGCQRIYNATHVARYLRPSQDY